MKNVNIKLSLLALFLIPTITLIYQMFLSTMEKNRIVEESYILKDAVVLSTKITALVHETQKERGIQFAFLSSDGKDFSDYLTAQIETTDAKYKQLLSAIGRLDMDKFPKKFSQTLFSALNELKNINLTRQKVKTFSLTPEELFEYYNNIHNMFFESITQIVIYSTNEKIIKELNSYINFLHAKEQSGIERALGAVIFSSDRIDPKTRIEHERLIIKQENYLKSFSIFADENSVSFLNSVLDDKVTKEVDRMRELIVLSSEIGGFNIDSMHWFNVMTKKINILKDIENFIASRIESSQTKLQEIITILKALNDILHETQKERGATSGYLGSKGGSYQEILQLQRHLTDKKIAAFKKEVQKFSAGGYYESMKSNLKSSLEYIDMLEKIRSDVDAQNISAKTAIDFYSKMNAGFINTTSNTIKLAKTTRDIKIINTYTNFLFFKENAGIERAVLSSVFASNRFDSGMKERFLMFKSAQESYLERFRANAGKEILDYYALKRDDPVFKEAEHMHNAALKAKYVGGFGIEPSYWFKTITKKIDLLKKAEDRLSAHIINEISNIVYKASKAFRWMLFLNIAVILIAALMGYFVFIYIVRKMAEEESLHKKIAETNKELNAFKDHLELKVDEGLNEIILLNNEIVSTQKEVVFTMGSIGETRSKETGNHVKRVAEYSKILALKYGLPEEEAELLKQASPMHDIGKVGIPDNILHKPNNFNDEEWKIMKTHTHLGYEMLKHSDRPILRAAAIIAYEHHERYDGMGYPKGLEKEDIHIYGRITAVADVFDALGSDRVYKKAWSDEEIFVLFEKERGKQFDPVLIDIFFEHIDTFLAIREELKDAPDILSFA